MLAYLYMMLLLPTLSKHNLSRIGVLYVTTQSKGI